MGEKHRKGTKQSKKARKDSIHLVGCMTRGEKGKGKRNRKKKARKSDLLVFVGGMACRDVGLSKWCLSALYICVLESLTNEDRT